MGWSRTTNPLFRLNLSGKEQNFYRRHFLKEASTSNVASVIERANKIHRPGLCPCENFVSPTQIMTVSSGRPWKLVQPRWRSAGSQSGCLCCPRWGNSTEAAQMGAMLHSTSHDLQTQNLQANDFPETATHTHTRLLVCSLTALTKITRRQPDAVSHQVSISFMLHQTSGAPTTCCFSLKAVQKYSKHESRVRKAKLAWM